ncbi:MAG: AGE family epimerase/isomerase [Candidatus Latescibacteria bacterium]|nr:AGE family epimerase/isomerase [Candidatus Latescibacterota bacterium]
MLKRPLPGEAKGGRTVRTEIAGMSLEALRDQYRCDLFDDYVAFWREHGIDREHGGFMCTMDHDGSYVNTSKSMRFQGRGLWTHSFLYNHFGGDEHLQDAKRTRDFVVKHGLAPGGAWFLSLDREGNPTGPPDPMGYEGLFMAEGLHEYAKASGDQEPMDLALESFRRGCETYDDASRHEPLGYTPYSYPGIRVQGFEMVTTVLLTSLVQAVPDPKLEARLDHAVDAVMNRFWNPEYRLNNEVLDFDYERPADENEDFIYLGHAIETMWMLLHEALRRKDRSLFDLVAERLERHMEVAWDDVYGGFFRALKAKTQEYTLDKVLWLQEEVLIGTMILMEHTDLEWPEWWFDRTFRYVQEKFPLKPHGHPLWILGSDRKVTFKSHISRQGNYHHPRHLMLNLLAVERMIERGGKVSDVWGT